MKSILLDDRMTTNWKMTAKSNQFIKFPSEHTIPIYRKQLFCVKCLEMVNPHYYMICKKMGHLICGKCAWVDTPPPPSPCCAAENLEKGNVARLEGFLNNVLWYCLYRRNGCSEQVKGCQWESHINECKFKSEQQCFYYKCEAITNGMEDTIQHYVYTHLLMEKKMDNAELQLDVIYDESDSAIKRRLALLNNGGKYYLFASEVTKHDLNIFLWDLQQQSKQNKKGEDGPGRRYRLALMPTAGPYDIGRMHYFGSCHPMDMSSDAIIKSGDCFSIGLDRLKMKYLLQMPQCEELKRCYVKVSFERIQKISKNSCLNTE